MRFSWKILLASLLFLLLCALITDHTISSIKNNTHTSVGHAIFDAVNPFWRLQNTENHKFPINIPITIDNPHNTEMIISGEIRLFDEHNQPLQNIGLENTTETSSGNLVDYITINPDRIAIEPNSRHIFDNLWYGFGDQYLSQNLADNQSSTPVTIFETPSEVFQNPQAFHLSFFEKAVEKKFIYNTRAEIKLSTLNVATNIVTEQPIKNENISVSYTIINKTLNSGLLINIGMVAILSLLLWEYISPRKKEFKSPRLSREELAEIEAEIAKIREDQKNTNQKKSSKNPKK